MDLSLATGCLALVLYGEAATHEQKFAVGSVVLQSAGHVSKVCDEVYKPGRYEYISKLKNGDGRYPNQKEFLQNKLMALQIIRNFNQRKPYCYFHDDSIKNPWGFKVQEKIGNMYFYGCV